MKEKYFILTSILILASSGSMYAQVRQISSSSELQTALADAKKNNQTASIKFYSPSCPHCKKFAKPYLNASNNHNNTVFLEVDIINNSDLAQSYGIQGVPTTVVIKADGSKSEVSGADINALNKALGK